MGIDRCLYEIPKNDLVDNMKLCVLLPNRNAGRLHFEKAESIQVCDFRVGRATTGAEAQGYDSHDANFHFSFPHPPSDFCPSPF